MDNGSSMRGALRRAVAGLTAALLSGLAGPPGAAAAERIAGPVIAEVVRVLDGDTLEVSAKIWLGQELKVSARIRGIDAPELRGKCRQEVMMAAAATDRLVAATQGASLRLSNIQNDKYAGRVVADVTMADGTELGPLMLQSGLVHAYDGGERGGWCDLAGVDGQH